MDNKAIVQIPKIMAQSLKVLKISVSPNKKNIITPADIDDLLSNDNQIEMINLEIDSLLFERNKDKLLQFRGALNRLLGKTAKTLKSIRFPDIYSNHLNLMKEIPLRNLSMCKNLEDIMFDLASHDMEYTLGLPKLRKAKKEKQDAISGRDLLKTKLNDFKY